MTINKKSSQLGMSSGKASNILLKDILWDFIVKTNQNYCCKCNLQMHRLTFSIEHIQPWLDSENPTDLFFNLNNISFSHLICNIKSARRTNKILDRDKYKEQTKIRNTLNKKKNYSKEKRKEKYTKTGQ